MRVISRRAIRDFVERRPASRASLDAWYRMTVNAEWKSLMDVRKIYPHADAVGRCTVFNIHGNGYRLISRINYDWQLVYIRGIYTHKEYDEGNWKYGCESI